ncbi:helix-turn-helix transcriptional regulator [Streptomyces sioyaensis]|uniref:helix-turn-helix transcriptional regulator n=1 Tax=Streptomyces sioyaensis TaxID=67364 RepID=UPI0037CD0E37
MSTSRPLLTQVEAAAACGVSRSTIRRRRAAGDLPGSVQDEVRGWLIPVDALLAAGFRLNAPSSPAASGSPDSDAGTAASPAGDDQWAAELRAEIERLRHEHALVLKDAQHAQEMAEQEAVYLKEQLAERGEHIESLQRALLALTPAPERAAIPPPANPAGAAAPVVPNQPTAAEGAQEPSARRRWWGGRR